ncbi:hypothetical protein TNCV_3534201 [Trichonephila clavipes]|nr:hypothetical protein TNCV_3534201 [Trichonephila clavipes]
MELKILPHPPNRHHGEEIVSRRKGGRRTPRDLCHIHEKSCRIAKRKFHQRYGEGPLAASDEMRLDEAKPLILETDIESDNEY